MKRFTPDVTFDARPDGVKVTYRNGVTVDLPDETAALYVRKGLGVVKREPKPVDTVAITFPDATAFAMPDDAA